MIEQLPQSTARILGFKMSGKLHDAEYKLFVPILETAIKAEGKVRLLAQFEDFHGSLHAMWDDTKFATQHCRDVERVALVGEQMGGMDGESLQAIHPCQAPVFDIADIESAWQWLSEPD